MAQVTLNSRDMINCLSALLIRLGQAIAWVSKHPGKVTLDIPDAEKSGLVHPLCGSCFAPIKPPARAETVLLLAIAQKMGNTGAPSARRKARK